MEEDGRRNLLGQASALMMVVRELLARLPEGDVNEIRDRVVKRLERHKAKTTKLAEELQGADEMIARVFKDYPQKPPVR